MENNSIQKLAILDIRSRKVYLYSVKPEVEITTEYIQDTFRFRAEDIQWMVYDKLEFNFEKVYGN